MPIPTIGMITKSMEWPEERVTSAFEGDSVDGVVLASEVPVDHSSRGV
jgi:hypothetical protein